MSVSILTSGFGGFGEDGNEFEALIKRYIGKTTLVNDASYSVYNRYDFRDTSLARKIEEMVRPQFKIQCSSRIFFTYYDVGGFINLHQDGNTDIYQNMDVKKSTHSLLLFSMMTMKVVN
jgi:hypothetical protein